MDINKILSELKSEREQIEQAILVLQGLAQGQRRRGRKPAWMKQAMGVEPKKRRACGVLFLVDSRLFLSRTGRQRDRPVDEPSRRRGGEWRVRWLHATAQP